MSHDDQIAIPLAQFVQLIEAAEAAYAKLNTEYDNGLDGWAAPGESWAEAERLGNILDDLKATLLGHRAPIRISIDPEQLALTVTKTQIEARRRRKDGE